MNVTDRPDVSLEKLQNMIENSIRGFKMFNILKTSIEIGIFDILSNPMSCKELSGKLGIEPILVHYLLEILVKTGLVEKKGDLYGDTQLSNVYLNSESNYKRIKCILSLQDSLDLWNNLDNTLKGKIARKDEVFFTPIIQVMAEDCLSGELQDTVEFIADYDEFKLSKTLLDLAGGHGMYSIALSEVNPYLQCYVFDLPGVLNETQKFIEKYNSRVKTIPGNFYTDDFGGKYDIIFSSYNPGGKNPEIAKKVYNSLNLNGLFINKQYFPQEVDESLGDLLDNMEWNFTKFEKSRKKNEKYSFAGDLSLKKYLKFLENLGFSIKRVYPINHFSNSFGSKSEDTIIIAKKVK